MSERYDKFVGEAGNTVEYWRSACDDLNALIQLERDRHTKVRAAALELIAKLDAVKPHIDSLETLAYVHGARYSGPEYGTALAALRALLADES